LTHIILSFLFLVNPYSPADINSEPTQGRKYAIGDEGFGGIIIYVDPTGEHGVVCSKKDVLVKGNDRMVWGCLDATIRGARATAMGTGDQNTKDIVETCTKGDTAADACRKFATSGYSDWYLPSKGELNGIYKLKKKGKLHLRKAGYWSSTGTGNGTAWVQTLGMGFQFVSAKYGAHRVRPVRKF
jgi:hypothetical protein